MEMDLACADYDVVGLRLPNGKIKVVKDRLGIKGEVFESEQAFYSKFQSINEGTGHSCVIMDMING